MVEKSPQTFCEIVNRLRKLIGNSFGKFTKFSERYDHRNIIFISPVALTIQVFQFSFFQFDPDQSVDRKRYAGKQKMKHREKKKYGPNKQQRARV